MAEDIEWLEIPTGFSLSTPAWRITDFSPLHHLQKRGQDLLIPHRRGRRAKPRRLDEQDVVLPLKIFAHVDENGDPHPNDLEGFLANVQTLNEALVLASDEAVAALWHRADGTEAFADIIVEDFDPTAGDSGLDGVDAPLHIVVPDGMFEVAGS